MLYSRKYNDIINNGTTNTYSNKNTGGNKYTGDSAVQVWTVLLTSDFNSSTRGERHNSYYADRTIWLHKRAAHLVVFKISVCRDLQNSNYMPQR